MFLTNASWVRNDFWSLLYVLSYRLTAQTAGCYKPPLKLLSLKWKPHRDELLTAVYRRNGYLETHQILPTYSKSFYWQNTCQNVRTDKK